MLLQIHHLIGEQKYYEEVRSQYCDAQLINKRGFHSHQAHRQRYCCKICGKQFDDLTGTIFEGRHLPSKVWILCLYFMGPNLSNEQIAAELDLSPSEVQLLTSQLRQGIVVKKSLRS